MTTAAPSTTRPRRVPAFARAMMRFQAFLLRRNWLGPLGEEVMVITVAGRKTGRRYSTPIGFLFDPEVRDTAGRPTILALTGADGASNWYPNVLRNPEAMLEIKGQALRVRGEPVRDEAERRRIFALYQRERRANFHRLFGLPADAPAEALDQALATRIFMRFHRIA
ncbi:MAG: nitroreductase family deazaflavin-dependent oxidoreductase [Anaerolineales bacterium]|nr:nitroreductase family deazaflavin-dependent oxidoreductase [Anaerolineales bacterium]